MAAAINKRDVYLLAATPRTVSVNLGTNVNVDGTVAGTPAGTVVDNADTGAAHAGSSGNPHGVSLTQISGDLDDISDGSTYFRTNSNQVTGAGRGFNALNSSNEYNKSLKSTQLTVVGSNPSTGWVGDSNGIRMYQSGVLKVNIPVSGDPYFDGDLEISGFATFGGNTTSDSTTWSGVFNEGQNSTGGLVGWAGNSGAGVRGNCSNSSSTARGVEGVATTATGVNAICTTGTALKGSASSGSGTALALVGKMTTNSTLLVSNLNADMVDGKHASSLCQGSNTNSGLATVSGNVLNIQVQGSLSTTVQTRASSNAVVIESVSDERLKQDIQDEKYGLDFICSLTPRSFRMRADPTLLAHGLIYQEVAKLIGDDPDSLASLNNDGTGSVDYNGIVSPIVLALQQLAKRVSLIEQHGGYKNGR
ncbi:MAG: tail fiber domain-containing protein [Nitrosomonas sp.]|nr:tail fiber domain-containing protein [Nitrosomonas sp.]